MRKVSKIIEFLKCYLSIIWENKILISSILMFLLYLHLKWNNSEIITHISWFIISSTFIIPIFQTLNKNANKDDYNFPIIIAIYIIVASLFTYLICGEFQIPSSPIVGTTDAWIGFSGSLIGGAITLFVLYLTLESQNKNKKKDTYYEHLPIIHA